MQTAIDRIDKALTLARTKASAYADAGDMAKAYRTLMDGTARAQRANGSSPITSTTSSFLGSRGVRTALIAASTVLSGLTFQTIKKRRGMNLVIVNEESANSAATRTDGTAI